MDIAGWCLGMSEEVRDCRARTNQAFILLQTCQALQCLKWNLTTVSFKCQPGRLMTPKEHTNTYTSILDLNLSNQGTGIYCKA